MAVCHQFALLSATAVPYLPESSLGRLRWTLDLDDSIASHSVSKTKPTQQKTHCDAKLVIDSVCTNIARLTFSDFPSFSILHSAADSLGPLCRCYRQIGCLAYYCHDVDYLPGGYPAISVQYWLHRTAGIRYLSSRHRLPVRHCLHAEAESPCSSRYHLPEANAKSQGLYRSVR